MKIPALLAPALCLSLAACDDVALSFACPEEPSPSVVVGVFDAGTGEAVAGDARGWYTVNGMTDSLRHEVRVGGIPQLFAFGPPGVYQVRVQRTGHSEWVLSDLVVLQSACGPATVRITANLEPAL